MPMISRPKKTGSKKGQDKNKKGSKPAKIVGGHPHRGKK